jgi:hypothetical protein
MSLNIPFRIYNNILARSLSSTLSSEQYFEIVSVTNGISLSQYSEGRDLPRNPRIYE